MSDIGDRIILDLCAGTGSWSRPYAEAGYDVRLVTLPTYDVRLFPSRPSSFARLPKEFDSMEWFIGRVHGILAAPPCRVFAASGAWRRRTDAEMIEGLSVVDSCIRIIHTVKPKWWALENPVGKLRKWLGPPVMTFHPCDFGDPYKKRTLLWGDFNTNLKKTPVEPIIPAPMYSLPRDVRPEAWSITPQGFARAFFEANP